MWCTNREIKIYNSLLCDYEKIDNDVALRERGLNWCDYKNMGGAIDKLRFEKECYVKSKGLANYFSSFGMTVTSYIDEYRVQL